MKQKGKPDAMLLLAPRDGFGSPKSDTEDEEQSSTMAFDEFWSAVKSDDKAGAESALRATVLAMLAEE
jgi:hypothetical protein